MLRTDGVPVNSQNRARRVRAAASPAQGALPTVIHPTVTHPTVIDPTGIDPTVILGSGETDPGGEPVVLLRPRAPRVVGPGRRERAYQLRIAGLESEREAAGEAQTALQAEVEMARLVERGTDRLVDRLERSLEQGQAELDEVRSQGHRLMVALGALQRENRTLRSALEQERARVLGPSRRISRGGLLGRLWGGRGRGRGRVAR